MKVKTELVSLLENNLDVFAWKQADLIGIDLIHVCHRLNINPKARSVRQKRKPMNANGYAALNEEVDKLISNRLIRETYLKEEVYEWRSYVDFTDLN